MQNSPNVFESVEKLIGRTPLVRLTKSIQNIPVGEYLGTKNSALKASRLESALYAKVEFVNPGGSVKDRIALHMVKEAENKGLLKPGGTIVEATSGNTGAGLAVVAAARGYKCIFVMPDKMSAEKVNALLAFGAKVVVSPSNIDPTSPDYYCNVAKRLASETPNAFHPNQYFNPHNADAHFKSTGPEIWEQMEGRIDAFIAGIGTGGTLSGTARYLLSKNPKIRIVAVDPKGSIYSSLLRDKKKTDAVPYLVEGVGEDMVPGAMDLSLPTDCYTVNDEESFAATRMLASTEGLLVGGSCGLAFFGAVQFLLEEEKKIGRGLRAVVLFPDSGSRYLSKVFNESWLGEKCIKATWPGSVGGRVEYLHKAKKIQGA